MSEVRAVRPQLFETLAQLALLQMAYSRLGHKYLSFAMPTGPDNAPTQAGVKKFFSTAWPLSLLRLVASWSHAHSVEAFSPLPLHT